MMSGRRRLIPSYSHVNTAFPIALVMTLLSPDVNMKIIEGLKGERREAQERERVRAEGEESFD